MGRLDDLDMTTSTRKADLLWLRKHYRYYFDHMKWYQTMNHFPEQSRIIGESDPQIQRALELLPEAEQLSRRALEGGLRAEIPAL